MSAQMLTPTSLVQIAQILDKNFSPGELQDLCFELNEDLADIAAANDTQKDAARKVAIFFQQRGRAKELVTLIEAKRPALGELGVMWESSATPPENKEPLSNTDTAPPVVPVNPLAKFLIPGAVVLAVLVLVGIGYIVLSGNTSPASTTRVAFARGPISASTLVIRELSSGKEITLARVEADTTDPSWSPDGQSIAASGGDGVQHDIVIYNAVAGSAGFGSVNRITTAGNDIDPDWSRTDNRIYFARGLTRDNGDILSVNPNGSDVISIGLKGRQPAVSPDGSHIVYMQKHTDSFWHIHIARTSNWADVCVLDAGNTSPTPNLRMPNWTADSKGVIFNYADRATEPKGLGYADLKECIARVSSLHGTQDLPPLGRPSCGGDFVCVANHSAVTGGNLRLLKFDPIANIFTDEGAITSTRAQGTADFAPDVYP